MKKFSLFAVLGAVVATAALFGTSLVDAAGTQLRKKDQYFEGVIYAGSSKVQLTNATGNLATTTISGSSGTFSGAVDVAGALGVTGAVTLKNAAFSNTSLAAGVTAATGSAQGDGPITTFAVQVTTSATNGDALTLPTPAGGRMHIACNAAASNSVDVFPTSGAQVNKESANTAIGLAAGECMFCFGFSTTRWGCVIGSAN